MKQRIARELVSIASKLESGELDDKVSISCMGGKYSHVYHIQYSIDSLVGGMSEKDFNYITHHYTELCEKHGITTSIVCSQGIWSMEYEIDTDMFNGDKYQERVNKIYNKINKDNNIA